MFLLDINVLIGENVNGGRSFERCCSAAPRSNTILSNGCSIWRRRDAGVVDEQPFVQTAPALQVQIAAAAKKS